MKAVWMLFAGLEFEHGDPDVILPFASSVICCRLTPSPIKMKTKQIYQLKRVRTGLRGWMTRDFDAVRNIIESDSPDVARVEKKLDSITVRLQKAEDLQMEIEKLLDDDSDERAEADAQGPWFDMVRDRIHAVKLWLKNSQKQNTSEKLETMTPKPKHTSNTLKIKLPNIDLTKFSGEVLD